MRKTLKRNLSYDDRNHLSYVSLYCDGEDGRRVRRTRTYPTMEQAEQVIAEYRRTQLLGGSEYDDEQPNIPNGIVRVGLAFGSTALDAVHLQIKTGSGFAFGYYDSDRVFQSVGYPAESADTDIADTNVTVGDSAYGA